MNDTIRRSSDIVNEDESGEFIVRKSLPGIWQLGLLFFVCFSVLYFVATHASFFGGNFGIALAIFSVIGPLTWFTLYYHQRSRDMVLAAEFQNALFSAAIRLKSHFCLIVKQNGTVFYYDRGFQRVFPETANRGVLLLEKILSPHYLTPQEARKLDYALEHNHSETVMARIHHPGGESREMVITVDPIPRPSGFFILRGRDYVVKDTAKPAGNPS
jgi:hypothetical protein